MYDATYPFNSSVTTSIKKRNFTVSCHFLFVLFMKEKNMCLMFSVKYCEERLSLISHHL